MLEFWGGFTFIWLLFAPLGLDSAAAQSSTASSIICDQFLLGEINPNFLVPNTPEEVETLPSVFFDSQSIKGGEESYWRFRRGSHQSWFSRYRSNRHDPQGDPRSAIFFLGLPLTKWIGISIQDPYHIDLPTVQTLNRRIDLLNRQLRSQGFSPIPLSFYEQKFPSKIEYLKHLQKMEYPISYAKATTTIHDYSYHLTAFTIPPEILEFVSNQIYWFLQLTEYPTAPEHFQHKEALIRHFVKLFDYFTATANQSFQTPDEEPFLQLLGVDERFQLEQRFGLYFSGTNHRSRHTALLRGSTTPIQLVIQHLHLYKVHLSHQGPLDLQMNQLIEAWLLRLQDWDSEFTEDLQNKSLNHYQVYSIESLIQLYKNRRLEIQSVAIPLSNP